MNLHWNRAPLIKRFYINFTASMSIYQQWSNVGGNFSSRNCYKFALVSRSDPREHTVRERGGTGRWGRGGRVSISGLSPVNHYSFRTINSRNKLPESPRYDPGPQNKLPNTSRKTREHRSVPAERSGSIRGDAPYFPVESRVHDRVKRKFDRSTKQRKFPFLRKHYETRRC